MSAVTGEGIADLCAAISARLVPEPPPAGAAVPLGEELCRELARLAAGAGAGDAAALRRLAAVS